MRIIFIGIHNKKGFGPLDSKTPSGKRIDAVIEKLKGYDCIKTNLFDTYEIPNTNEASIGVGEFIQRTQIQNSDICVLLGGTVQHWLGQEIKSRVVYAPHPSPMFSKYSYDDYVAMVSTKIVNSEPNPKRGVTTEAK